MIYVMLEDNIFYIVTVIKTATDKKLEGGLNEKGMYHLGFESNITYACNRIPVLKIKC